MSIRMPYRVPRKLLYLAILLPILVPLSVSAQREPFGPFAVRDQFPVKLLFLSLRPDAAPLLPDGSLRLSTQFAYSNTYAVTSPVGDPTRAATYYQAAPLTEYRLSVDTETLRITFDLGWRIDDRWQIGLEFPLMVQMGGFLDSTIEGFHGLFNLSNGGRENTPRNDYGVYVARNARFWISEQQPPPVRIGDTVVRLKSPIVEAGGRFPSVSVLTAVKLPTGSFDHLSGSGSLDLQLALLVSQRIGASVVLHYNLARTKLGTPDQHVGFPVKSAIISQMFAFEYIASDRLSVIGQILGNTSPFPKGMLGPLDRTAYEINAGIKYVMKEDLRLEVGLIENVSQFQNTPDVGVHARLELTL
ncbi:MAG: DUF3187 family protein [Candidatus Latescibacteria bacterium]|nr:DUF3187 family protein [Candidatus Latescibacterota bacterium]